MWFSTASQHPAPCSLHSEGEIQATFIWQHLSFLVILHGLQKSEQDIQERERVLLRAAEADGRAVFWTVFSLAWEPFPSPHYQGTAQGRQLIKVLIKGPLQLHTTWSEILVLFLRKTWKKISGCHLGNSSPCPALWSTWWWGAQGAGTEVASQPCWHCITVNASKNMLQKRKAFTMSPGLPLSCEVLTTVIAYHVK